ncbi:MAG TPA: nucleotidyltransferase family protein [Candidatus Acidoferrales bacterium]|jgi:molybdenum cofactor cytidylyltransferase|nr:nucleotidyltransferase family protein [Candidatus Acidoferrales bacterium]
MLAAAILAAGESQRMGQPKALVPFQGLSFVEHLITATRHARIGLTRIVLGAGANDIRAKLPVDSASIVVNPDWPKGQLSSIHAAIRSLPSGATEGLMICPVDHPLISPHLVAQLVRSFDSSDKPVILPKYHGRRGHPVIFRAVLYEELLAAPDEVGARQVVWDHATEISEVETEEEGVILNLNDPETLRKALGHMGPWPKESS